MSVICCNSISKQNSLITASQPFLLGPKVLCTLCRSISLAAQRNSLAFSAVIPSRSLKDSKGQSTLLDFPSVVGLLKVLLEQLSILIHRRLTKEISFRNSPTLRRIACDPRSIKPSKPFLIQAAGYSLSLYMFRGVCEQGPLKRQLGEEQIHRNNSITIVTIPSCFSCFRKCQLERLAGVQKYS